MAIPDYVERWSDKLGERVRSLIDRANQITPAYYEQLLNKQHAIRAQIRSVARKADGVRDPGRFERRPVGHVYTGSRTFLAYWSWSGFPAFSLPLMQVGKLPLGLQLAGVGGGDGELAAIANWLMRR